MNARQIMYLLTLDDALKTDASWRHYRKKIVDLAKQAELDLTHVMLDAKDVWRWRHSGNELDTIEIDGIREDLVRLGMEQ